MIRWINDAKVDLAERNYTTEADLWFNSRALSARVSVHYLVSRTLTESYPKCRGPARSWGRTPAKGRRAGGKLIRATQPHFRCGAALRRKIRARAINRSASQSAPRLISMDNHTNPSSVRIFKRAIRPVYLGLANTENQIS